MATNAYHYAHPRVEHEPQDAYWIAGRKRDLKILQGFGNIALVVLIVMIRIRISTSRRQSKCHIVLNVRTFTDISLSPLSIAFPLSSLIAEVLTTILRHTCGR